MTNFEPIYAALFAKLSAIPGLKTTSRRMAHWADVPAKQQPALFMIQSGETNAGPGRSLPSKWQLKAEVYLYVQPGEGKIIPSQVMNPLLGAIRDALLPDNMVARTCTLGGLVSHCWISGEVEVYDGVLGDQAVAVIPIDMLTAE